MRERDFTPSQSTSLRYVFALLAWPLVAACSSSSMAVCGGAAAAARVAAPPVGGPSVADGSRLELAPGQITVVNVWGAWCGPCRTEQQVLNRLAAARPDVRFLGLDVQDNDAAARAHQKEFGVTYPSINDNSRELASRLGALSTPATIVIDRSGVIRGRAQGALDVDGLTCLIGLAT